MLAKSKGQYAQIDKATNGQFQRFDNALRKIQIKLREVADIDPEQEAKLTERQQEIEAAQNDVFEKAKAQGLDENLVNEAKANWKKSQALYDVDQQLKASTSGMRPGIGESGKQSTEIVDPKKLFARLNKLYDSGRIQDAVGEQNARQLLKAADDAQRSKAAVTTAKVWRDRVLKYALGSGVAYEAGKGVLSGLARP